MGALSQFLSHLYTMSAVFFTLLLLEVIILVRSATRSLNSSEANNDNYKRAVITRKQYLEFVEEKNPTIQYKKDCHHESSLLCSVCLCEYEEGERVRKLVKCKHTFHKDCLDRWLQHYWATCPLCRTQVLPDEIVSSLSSTHHHHQLQDRLDYEGSDEEMIFFLSALDRNTLYRFF